MAISGNGHSSKVAVEFVTVWWRALVIAVMISLSTEECLLVDERIQVVTVTVRFAKRVSYVHVCTVRQ